MNKIKILVFQHNMYVLFCILFIAAIIPSCKLGSSVFGENIPKDLSTTRLGDILDNPLGYNQKKVVLEGVVTAQCPALCDFSFQDGTNASTIFPQGFKSPKIKSGTKVKVYASILGRENRAIISALGIEILQ